MPLSDHGKIMIGWLGVWISGGCTFFLLQKHIESSRKGRILERKMKRRERERRKREKEAIDAQTAGQAQLTENA